MSDPRALYDAADHRFWAAMLQVEGAIGVATGCPEKTVYYIAVSQTSDPSGSWNVYVFDMSLGTTNVADFTQLGLNGDAVFFSANMFTQDGSAYAYAELFEANKARMEGGRGGFTADGFFNLSVSGPTGIQFLADTVQPALDLGGGTNSDGDWRSAGAEPFVDTFDAPDPITGNFCSSTADACSGLALWNLSNPTGHDRGGKAPTLAGTYVPTILPYSFPPAADQPTCVQCIDASDLRISAIPMLQGGRIFTAWETGIDNRTTTVPGIEWAQIDVADASSKSGARSGYYFFGGHAAATYPALMPAPDGSLAMVYEYMSPATNPQTRYVVRDPNSSQFQGRGVLLKAGEAAYRPTLCGTAIPVCRWGDYEAASFDGGDRIWLAGQYANAHTDPNAARGSAGTGAPGSERSRSTDPPPTPHDEEKRALSVRPSSCGRGEPADEVDRSTLSEVARRQSRRGLEPHGNAERRVEDGRHAAAHARSGTQHAPRGVHGRRIESGAAAGHDRGLGNGWDRVVRTGRHERHGRHARRAAGADTGGLDFAARQRSPPLPSRRPARATVVLRSRLLPGRSSR